MRDNTVLMISLKASVTLYQVTTENTKYMER